MQNFTPNDFFNEFKRLVKGCIKYDGVDVYMYSSAYKKILSCFL